MGRNTQGIISNRIGVRDIAEVLESKFNVTTYIENTHEWDQKRIEFNHNGEVRNMAVFLDYNDTEHIGFTGMDKVTLIDLSLWGSSIELIEGIVEEFGGYVVDDDCSDDWRWVG